MSYATTQPRYKVNLPEADFDSAPEMAPYLEEPDAMYVGAPGKHGYLRMGFELDKEGRSIMRDLEAHHPIVVQKELYFDEQMPELPCVYILSSGGPYVNGDRYRQDITMRKGSMAWVSTGAATKIAEMRQNYVGLRQHITMEEDTYLEFLPEPVYPGLHSRFISDTDVKIDASATLVYAEIYMCGRKYYVAKCPEGEIFRYDVLSVCTHAERPDGTPLFREKFLIQPPVRFPKKVGVMDNYDVFANLLVITPKDKADAIYDAIIPFINKEKKMALGITRLPSDAGLLIKILGMESGPVKKLVRECASKVRAVVKDKPMPEEFPWR